MNRKTPKTLMTLAVGAFVILTILLHLFLPQKPAPTSSSGKTAFSGNSWQERALPPNPGPPEEVHPSRPSPLANSPPSDMRRPAHHVKVKVDLGPETDRIANEFLVRFKDLPSMRAFLEESLQSNLTILDSSEGLLTVRLKTPFVDELMEYLDPDNPPEAIGGNHFVFTPNLPEKYQLDEQQSYGAFGNNALSWLGLSGQADSEGANVLVAVLDTGVEDHDALDQSRVFHLDLIGDGKETKGEYSGHGTGVSAIIAGQASYAAGLAPNADVLSVHVLDSTGSGDTFTVAKGILAAVDRGADVINLSLGSYADNPILRKAVEFALSNGVAIVAATGNDGKHAIMYPARYDGVIAVGAVDAKRQVLSFSNQGSEIDITAPGYGVYTAWSSNQIVSFSGTSASAAFVSGAIARLLSDNQALTAEDAVALVLRLADDSGGPGKDDRYGYGILNYGRILERNQKGIYDIAVGGFDLPGTYSISKSIMKTPVVVTLQNRGTEVIRRAEVAISIDGRREQYRVEEIQVGESIGVTVDIDMRRLMSGKSSRITAEAEVLGVSDRYPQNNELKTIIRLNPQ